MFAGVLRVTVRGTECGGRSQNTKAGDDSPRPAWGANEKERWGDSGLSEGRAPGLADRPDCGGDAKVIFLCASPNPGPNISEPFLLLPCSFLTLTCEASGQAF